MNRPPSKALVWPVFLWPLHFSLVLLLWPCVGCSLVIGTNVVTVGITFSELEEEP